MFGVLIVSNIKKKVIVGLSGGVDSSVSTYLLLKNNKYDVEAAFMRNWDSVLNNDILGNNTLNNEICTQEKDYLDAIEISKSLKIKLHRIDFISEYWEYVFKYFIYEYKSGRTPNPDILCNKYIKFNEFLIYALKNYNADYIAMGHYARIIYNNKLNEYELLKSIDKEKDQTYFLCMLNQKQLEKIIFPIGDLKKTEVRKIAMDNKLTTANKKDSTGICFIGERDFKNFLKNYIPSKEGNIIDINNNKIVGKHDGVMYYTIGQRRGLNLGGMNQRYFVVGKNISKRILYVSSANEDKWLLCNKIIVSNINFINSKYKNLNSFECEASFRYRQNPFKIFIKKLNNDRYEIISKNKLRSITTGQYAVFYNKNVCLGGATIEETYNDKLKLEYINL